MRKHSFSTTATAPIELREAKVFKINASRYNLCPEASERFQSFFSKVHDATMTRIISNPVKPSSHYENLGRAWKELADYGSAVRKNDPRKAQEELFDLIVSLVVLGSLSDHLIKID